MAEENDSAEDKLAREIYEAKNLKDLEESYNKLIKYRKAKDDLSKKKGQ